MRMWKTIKNFFDVIKQFNFKSFYSKKEISIVNQDQTLESSMILRLKKKNVKSRKHI
jgi:hypothetical protein